jgi:hypothetical protein
MKKVVKSFTVVNCTSTTVLGVNSTGRVDFTTETTDGIKKGDVFTMEITVYNWWERLWQRTKFRWFLLCWRIRILFRRSHDED